MLHQNPLDALLKIYAVVKCFELKPSAQIHKHSCIGMVYDTHLFVIYLHACYNEVSFT